MASSSLPTTCHRPPHISPHSSIAQAFPTFEADLHVSSLWVCECQHRAEIRHQRNQNITRRCKTPFQRASSIASLSILHVIPIICVYLSVSNSLWMRLEALQHQRALGMHPLSEHTHSPTPGPTPGHTHKHHRGRTRLLAIAHLIVEKNHRSLWRKICRNFLKANGCRLPCVQLLIALNAALKGWKLFYLMGEGRGVGEYVGHQWHLKPRLNPPPTLSPHPCFCLFKKKNPV